MNNRPIIELAAARDRLRGPRLPPGGAGGHDGGMERLEKRVDSLEIKLDAVRVDVAEIKGKISQMPTTLQMAQWFVGVALGLVALVFAVSFTIARAIT